MIPTQSANLKGQAVLVTGASGFISGRLCERLTAMDVPVHAVSRSLASDLGPQVVRIQGDLCDPELTRRLLRQCRPSLIFHLAGVPAAAHEPQLVWRTFQSNLMSTVSLLSAAAEFGAPRIVLTGSSEEPDTPHESASPYGLSKWVSSAYGRMFHSAFKLPVSIARIFFAYGPTHRHPQKLMPYLIRSLLEGRSPQLSSGRREIDWIHVDDVIEGLLALATSPQAIGQTLDIGSGSLVSIRELAERIAALVKPSAGVRPLFDPALDRPAERVCVADVATTHAQIGWRAGVDLDQGLSRTVEWFRRHAEPPSR